MSSLFLLLGIISLLAIYLVNPFASIQVFGKIFDMISAIIKCFIPRHENNGQVKGRSVSLILQVVDDEVERRLVSLTPQVADVEVNGRSVSSLKTWCSSMFLDTCMSKTKQTCFYLRRCQEIYEPTEEALSILLPQLPDDVVFDILSRLPLKTLVRFSCVCKAWQKLITSDRGFSRSQLQNSVKNLSGFKNILLSNCERLDYCIGARQENHSFDPPLKLTAKLINGSENPAASQLIFRQGKLKIAGCCDGIICLVKFCNYSCRPRAMVYLCNPALKQCRALPPSNYQGKSYPWSTILGFLFDPVSVDYKVLKIIELYCFELVVEIYCLSNNSWKTFSVRKISNPSYNFLKSPVVHNGFPYWLAGDSFGMVLNVLDIVQEKIEGIQVPTDSIKCQLDLGVFQGSLSIFGWNSSSQNMVWVMKEDGLGISWIKQVTILPLLGYFKPLSNVTTGITASRKCFLVSDQGIIFHYDPENKKVEEQKGVTLERVNFYKYVLADYVASLASVYPC